MGGTELAKRWMAENIDQDLLDTINIVSRPDDYKPDANNVLWVHDLPADMPFLASARERDMFKEIVFVSSWQQTVFFMNMGVPYSESTVIRNAIYPIEKAEKPDDGKVRLVYHPTPHRGLEILVPVFVELCKKYDNLHLDVFSSFDLYSRPEANKPYEELFKACDEHPNITYHGTQPNKVVRDALRDAHIFAYPCIWRETSCISAMEAMSARCVIVAPEYSALPETLANFNISYGWTESVRDHATRFSAALERAIESAGKLDDHLDEQKAYCDKFYSWERRAPEWEAIIKEIQSGKVKKKRGLQWS